MSYVIDRIYSNESKQLENIGVTVDSTPTVHMVDFIFLVIFGVLFIFEPIALSAYFFHVKGSVTDSSILIAAWFFFLIVIGIPFIPLGFFFLRDVLDYSNYKRTHSSLLTLTVIKVLFWQTVVLFLVEKTTTQMLQYGFEYNVTYLTSGIFLKLFVVLAIYGLLKVIGDSVIVFII